MKSKTGLHKKVACIFDGTPTGTQQNPSAAAGQPPSADQFQAPPSTYGPQPIPVHGSAKTAPAKSSKSAGRSKTMARPAGRQGKTDPKQRKMMIMIGVLTVVLVGVLYFVLVGPAAAPQKAAAGNAAQPAQTSSAAAAPTPWTRPEPWPEEIRDPMTLTPQSQASDGTPTDCVVKGIVFSQAMPSAIVGDRIVFVGDTLNGTTITAINKETVEFEKDGKRWTQQVQQ